MPVEQWVITEAAANFKAKVNKILTGKKRKSKLFK